MTEKVRATVEDMSTHIRPLERRVRDLRESGVSYDEIAWRFRRSPGFIRRVSELSEIKRPSTGDSPTSTLRPVERVVRSSAERGLSTNEIAARLRRSPAWVRRVQVYTDYKLSQT